MAEVWIVYWVGAGIWALLTHGRLRSFLHILQLEEYYTPQYVRWLNNYPDRYLKTMYGALTAPLVAALVVASPGVVGAIALVGWTLVGAVIVFRRPRIQAKKPLVMTARARRVRLTAMALWILVVVLAKGIALLVSEPAAVAAGVIAASFFSAFAGHLLALANVLLAPVEARMRRKFELAASKKLEQRRPKIIAITGSAGKTTTKEMVAHLLSARYRVLKTPASFNTPMGISRTVNDLLADQDYFVVEMGAYTKGEIARLCRLVGGTDISVITTVNAQHLERFGSIEKTAEAKWEIVEGLRPGGTAVLNYDVDAVRERGQSLQTAAVLPFGIKSADVPLRATAVREQEGGIELDVAHGDETATVRVSLLGRHNAGNVLAALGVGLTCGLDLPYMAAALRQFHSPDHRLQPLKLPTGGILLDDGYNGNPQGIIGALEVLGAYAPKRRILITPGLIEMGRDKQRYHAEIGWAAAKNTDIAFLVGPKQTADIRAAMLESGFPESSLHTTRSLAEARSMLEEDAIGSANDVILIANDLPDQFDEYLAI
ncbi:MAG TPA: UDP-N-acetylmuramoyl-tripeptide--D-alanyl-D-alanine ligase [Dehalococcoidia bacterium]|jgi:UDP-N-acetylmuramoyl-tripeptide--D-alanyl-D-alanine ligase|nr:UDP-N-acetylmuramoyl-tripeptide--D-alanyl-D-alanine ligase [Dehalococcoidia bacterium]